MKTRSCRDSKNLHLVTGGAGFPGFSLGKKLSQMGHRVRLLDAKESAWIIPDNIDFVKVDIRNYEDVMSAMEDVCVVYHMASYGMSGKDQLKRKMIEEVNVHGTKNVLKACREMNVTRLVYTSTYNVVFGGQEIVNGDETLPYLLDHQFTDYYSKTKKEAEVEVLAADGSSTDDGSTLHMCALRLAGVYGLGEQRHIPRIVSYLERGLVCVTYGSGVVDFLHIDNLIQAHILAAKALTPQHKHIAAGQSYFISDGKPIKNFEFFRPLIEGLGYTFPKVCLPLKLVFYLAFMLELIHLVLGRLYNFDVILTRTEVHKTGVTHTFSIEKARKELGYEPTIQNDMSDVVRYYQRTGHVKQKSERGVGYYLMNILIAFFIAIIILSFLPLTSDL
ncbi:short-chain dehydrogenase/reductase family 42E member 1-like isoform X1 [Gigantopelta aegis]|uniref:short-chain dehydrogenase/reductase family 42E member 1-like isoform X1 n=1 Tax=Gigantopelta aegis TaxID=1735272 RepID=UPI001B88A87E|nr:short-chain dehydrogenase/reductase family 42E member 1-like isoform X1 [Gigantopelta aegis]